MRSIANNTCLRVMDGIVIDEQRHTNNIHGHVCRQDKEDTLVLIFIDLHKVIFSCSLYPVAVKQKEDAGIVMVAFSQDDAFSLKELPISLGNTCENVENQRLEIDCTNHDGS